MEEKAVSIEVESDVATRKGTYADVATLASKRGTTRIDFVSTDSSDGEVVKAVLSARVYMDNADIIALRDMLNNYTASWKVTENVEEA